MPRRRRPLVAVVAVALSAGVVAGCTAGKSSATAPASPAAVTATGTSTASATALRAAALRVTAGLRSYAFLSTQRVSGGGQVTAATVSGVVVTPAAIDYTVTLGGRHEEVIRVGSATFLRALPGPWQRLRHPPVAPDPLSALLRILTDLTRLTAATGGSGSVTLTGQLSPSAARAAGLIPRVGGAALPVTVTLDAAHHVTTLSVRVPVRAGSQTLIVTQMTRFTSFDRVPPIRSPI
ncbi:MAG TPA: hypothetical protein VNE21_08950 [Mycobacteriales bacterium]|nr:hypothetical protein [Mycobacteriales bacterium]